MSIETQLRWLKPENLSQTSARFAEFCLSDVKQYENDENFDIDIYQEAIKRVIEKLEKE